MSDLSTLLLGGSIVGIGAGLSLLARGFSSYRRAGRVADTATSRIGMLAVGEVRVSGLVEPAELTLVSPLQSRTCVYFRARIREQDGRDERTVLDDERAVGFRVRDETGTIRVFPRGASWDVPSCFTDSDGFMGETPAGYNDTVYRFDTRIRQFPTNLLAGLFGWTERPFFSAPTDERSMVTANLTMDDTDSG
jgi:hypothetical protein